MDKAHKKIKQGVVVSDKMDKTVVVEVSRKIQHPFYGKTMNKSQKFKAHDEKEQCKVGDKVRIIETRPLSKDKRWRILEIVGEIKGKIEDEDKGMPALLRRKKEEAEALEQAAKESA